MTAKVRPYANHGRQVRPRPSPNITIRIPLKTYDRASDLAYRLLRGGINGLLNNIGDPDLQAQLAAALTSRRHGGVTMGGVIAAAVALLDAHTQRPRRSRSDHARRRT